MIDRALRVFASYVETRLNPSHTFEHCLSARRLS